MKHIIVKLLLILAMSGLAIAGSLSISTEEKEQVSEALAQIYDIKGEIYNADGDPVLSTLQESETYGKWEAKDYIFIYKTGYKSGIFLFSKIKNPRSSLSRIEQIDFKVGSSLVIDATLPAGLGRIVYSGNPSGATLTSTETNDKANLESDAYKSKNKLWVVGYAPKRFYDYSKKEFSELPGCTKKTSPNYGIDALGNCTWYAQGRLIELGYNKNLANKFSGNAKSWSKTAIDNGVKMDKTPTIGAIAQRGSNPFGHVAIVENVNADGTIDISESSWAPCSNSWNFEWRIRRNISPTTFENYIHLTK